MGSARVGSNPAAVAHTLLIGVVGNISACHADARGSIPRSGAPKKEEGVRVVHDTLAELVKAAAC